MKRLLTLLALSLVVAAPGAHACTKNSFGLCSGDCPKSKPVCSTKLSLDGITCECVRKTKNEVSTAVVDDAAQARDPIVDALIELGAVEE